MSLLGAAVLIAISRSAISRQQWHTGLGNSQKILPLLLPAVDVFSGTFQPWRGPVLLLGSLGLVLLHTRRGLSHRAGFVIAVALPLLVYVPNLSPYVGRADTFEFQVTALRLGIAHPTGYPLYVLLGKLFTLLPFGTLAWKVNLTSAVCAAGAAGLVYLLIYRITKHPTIAVLTALALAWSSTVWSQAVVAEVYALNLLFVAGALWLALDILEGRSLPRTLWRAALLMGLSLSNHITMVMLIPALGLACLLRWPRLSLRDWLKAVGLFALGLAVYAYIPLRWPALHEGQWMSLAEFLAYITGRQFGGALQLGLLRDPTRYAILWQLLRTPFGVAGLALATSRIAVSCRQAVADRAGEPGRVSALWLLRAGLPGARHRRVHHPRAPSAGVVDRDRRGTNCKLQIANGKWRVTISPITNHELRISCSSRCLRCCR